MGLLPRTTAAILILIGLAGAAPADGKVTVVTSYSADMTDPIEHAFEAALSGTDIEILNKNTSAGVKYLQEIAGSNTIGAAVKFDVDISGRCCRCGCGCHRHVVASP